MKEGDAETEKERQREGEKERREIGKKGEMKGGKEGGRRKLERISEYCSVEDIYMELYGTQ